MKKFRSNTIILLHLMIFLFSIIISSCYEYSSNSSNPSLLSSVSSNNEASGTPPDASGIGQIRTTIYGDVQGTIDVENTWAWLGVPYAKPPVGSLRWKAPRNPDSWNGTRKADAFCSICPQYGNTVTETGRDSFSKEWGKGVLVGREDCLYLNIWRPQTREKLPVLVFIHGGANIIGASDVSNYNGARLAARENMVVITINYRLGQFGWFTHTALKNGDKKDDSGNFGTLDIIKALEWIKNNVSSFGGDPGNVTIGGQSAGGWNVISMLVSPLSEGLFNRAISMSGAPTSKPVIEGQLLANATLYRLLINDNLARNEFEAAMLVLIKGRPWTADYLRSKTMSDFFPPHLAGPLGVSMDGGPLALFQTGIYEDGYVIPGNVTSLLKAGKYKKVPMILGCTTEELKVFIPYLFIDPGTIYDVMQNFDPDNPESTFHLKEMMEPILWPILYVYDPIVELSQISFQINGVDNTAKIMKGFQDDVYAYKFAWNKEPYPFDFFMGACHAMDIPFIFGTFLTDKSSMSSFAWSDANKAGREELSSAMMSYIAQFARTGNPNKPGCSLPEWAPWNTGKGALKRMIFDTGTLHMSADFTEPSEIPDTQDVLAEIMKMISNP